MRRLLRIGGSAVPRSEASTQAELRCEVAALRSAREPAHGFGGILRDTPPHRVDDAEAVHRLEVPARRRLLEPLDAHLGLLRPATPLEQQHAEPVLRLGEARLGRR